MFYQINNIRRYAAFVMSFFLLQSMNAQDVDQSRGVDQGVDYASLKSFGPWDDRNYELTVEDLALFSENEAELRVGVPAFYRVLMRKRNPNLMKTGPVQYPRSALPRFNVEFTGYLIEGEYYRSLVRENGRFRVLMDQPLKTERVKEVNNKMSTDEVRVTSPEGAAESAIKVHPFNPDIVIAGSNGPGGGQKMHWSDDGGLNWTETTLPLGGTCCDPTIDYSSDGAFAYSATLIGAGAGPAIFFYRSSDNGQSWDDLDSETPGDPRREFGTNGGDKEYIHVDKYCGSPHKDNIYITWHDGNIMKFVRSTDMGVTFDSEIAFNADPRGIGSDIATDKEGIVYYVYPAFGTREILLKRSTDGGASFEQGTITVGETESSFTYSIPSMNIRQVFIYNAIDVDLSTSPYEGSIYVSWTDTYAPDAGANNNHSRIQVAYSRDQGETWTVTTPHETADANEVDRFHQWLAVDLEGNVHVVYYDTRQAADRRSVDLYHSVSTDGGQTWSAPERLTSESSPKINNGFEFGDYNGLDHVVRQSTIFTDNRDESGNGNQSVDVYSTTTLTDQVNNAGAPNLPSLIYGPKTICAGQKAQYEVRAARPGQLFNWTYSDPNAIITNNGNRMITIEGITEAGTLSVQAETDCGVSGVRNGSINLASPEVCNLTDCVVNRIVIDDPTIVQSDIFEAIQRIESDATIATGDSKIMVADRTIEFFPGFTAQQSSYLVAQIEDCTSN